MKSVRIVEVGPRDGLQNIPQIATLSTKLNLIKQLKNCGLRNIELTSFESCLKYPQLADNTLLATHPRIQKVAKKVRLITSVHDKISLTAALKARASTVTVFVSASEGFSGMMSNCSVEKSLENAKELIRYSLVAKTPVRGHVGCVFGDPYDGPTDRKSVLSCVRALLDAGCYEVTLGDTVGVATPSHVYGLLGYLKSAGVPVEELACRFNDTHGLAIINAHSAYACGIRVFDSSIAGLGGCPMSTGAGGIIATEDLLYMFRSDRIQTCIDLPALARTAAWLSHQLCRPSASRVGSALGKISRTRGPKFSWSVIREAPGIRVFRCEKNIKVVFNQPKDGNYLTRAMIASLTTLFRDLRDDPTVSYVVLTGEGRHFSMGLAVPFGPDLIDLKHESRDHRNIDDLPCEMLGNLVEAMHNAPQTTLALVNGSAFGAGEVIALSCDICISAPEAEFGMTDERIARYMGRKFRPSFKRELIVQSKLRVAAELEAKGLISYLAFNADDIPLVIDQVLKRLDQPYTDKRWTGPSRLLLKQGVHEIDRSINTRGLAITGVPVETQVTAEVWECPEPDEGVPLPT